MLILTKNDSDLDIWDNIIYTEYIIYAHTFFAIITQKWLILVTNIQYVMDVGSHHR